MSRRDLIRTLSRLGFKAMPAEEARKFHQVLGGPRHSLPRDGLPPITINRPTRTRRCKNVRLQLTRQLKLL